MMNHFPRMMGLLEDIDTVNAILAELADEGTVEPMVEPIDESDCCPFDYAEVAGLWDELYPEPMVDENSVVWDVF